MKLIDLLVQELPKQGGWPGSQYDGEVMKIDNICWSYKEGCYPTAYMNGETVRKSEYEAALAASQQQAWGGEGLPPVGCECEARYLYATNAEWFAFRCVAVDCEVAFGWGGKEPTNLTLEDFEFRPILTEAERKRDEVIKQISHSLRANGSVTNEQLDRLYDDIADGKISHITLK